MFVAKICGEAQPYLAEMMKDPFGNYLFQKIVDHVDEAARTNLVTQVRSLKCPRRGLGSLAALRCDALRCAQIAGVETGAENLVLAWWGPLHRTVRLLPCGAERYRCGQVRSICRTVGRRHQN